MSSPRIFISYSSKDRKIVEQIHIILESLNDFAIWRDQTRLETDWSREIAFALAESDVLCLMWSKSAADSKWVKHEWLTARALEKRIIPLLLPDAPVLPEPLHTLHGVRLKKNDPNEACQEVANRLRESESFIEPYDYKVLPANSYIPFNPNPEFTGRHVDLLELYLKMIGNLNKIGINQVGAIGMGGVGKTQLAAEFAYRFSFAFGSVFWIQAADVEQWSSELVVLSRDRLQLSISDPDKPQADKRYIFRLQKYFKDNPQTLIIMDNVIEPKLLNNDTYLDGLTPLSLGCNLLFTTRHHFSLKGVTSQAINVLSPESAYMLLTHNLKPITPEEDDHARAICNAVGYLPLAIILAAGYLNEYTDVSFSDYQAELIKNKLDVIDIGELSEEELATRHVAAVSIPLEEDWKKITDENSRLLFQLAGQFEEAETIPKARLGLLAGIASGKNKLHRPLDKAINLLHSLSLAEKMESDSRAIRLHPLVRDFALKTVPENEQIKFRSNAAENLRSAYFDYPRLENEINARGVTEVLDDLQIAINWWGKDAQVSKELRLLSGTLLLSYNQLTRDPLQLTPHLIGRLTDIDTRNVQKLLSDAFGNQKEPWFDPICCSLTPPGSSLLRTFEGHSGGVKALAISPDGETAVSGSGDNTLKLWDLGTGKVFHTLKGHNGWVKTVAISPDGKMAVSGSWDNTLKLWDLGSGKVLNTLEGHSGGVSAVAISPDGKMAVSGSWDNTLKLWDLSSGKAFHALEGHSDRVTTVAINPDGKTAVFGSDDKTIKLWDLGTGKVLNTLEGHSRGVTTVAISPDGKTAVSGSDDKTVKLWDLGSGKVLKTLEDHSDRVIAVAISPDGKTAVSGSYDHTVKLWDLGSGKVLKTLEGHSGGVIALTISPDGKTAVSGSDDKTIKLWDLGTGKVLNTRRGHNKGVIALTISPDGKTAVSGSYDKTIKLWDLGTGKVLNTLVGHRYGVRAVAISPDGKTAVSGSYDRTVKLWDLGTGKVLNTLEGHSRGVRAVAISQDGKTAISGSDDNILKLWDLDTGKLLNINPLEGHSYGVTAVAISPDGKTAVSGSSDNTLNLWDLGTDKVLNPLEGHSHYVTAVAISPDGKNAVSGSGDGTLKLWDLGTGEVLNTLEGHIDEVTAVAISPDGKTAVSGSDDWTVKLWDHSAGQVIASFIGEDSIMSLAISPCGRIVIAGESNGHLHFLRIEGGE